MDNFKCDSYRWGEDDIEIIDDGSQLDFFMGEGGKGYKASLDLSRAMRVRDFLSAWCEEQVSKNMDRLASKHLGLGRVTGAHFADEDNLVLVCMSRISDLPYTPKMPLVCYTVDLLRLKVTLKVIEGHVEAPTSWPIQHKVAVNFIRAVRGDAGVQRYDKKRAMMRNGGATR